MSVAYHRAKMRLTTVTVDKMRRFCDGCNVMISLVTSPFRRIGARIGAEAPWVVVIFACSGISIFPLMAYPMLKPILVNDKRAEREEERVRLCLQKGIDPYPYMRHKDFIFGNTAPCFGSEEESPLTASWEYNATIEFQRRKEELRKEVGGSLDDTVGKMLRLREQYKKEFAARQHKVSEEPKELIFWGRKDVDTLRS